MSRTHPQTYLVAIITTLLFYAGVAAADSAEAMIEASKHKGGLAVMLGCDDLALLSDFACFSISS